MHIVPLSLLVSLDHINAWPKYLTECLPCVTVEVSGTVLLAGKSAQPVGFCFAGFVGYPQSNMHIMGVLLANHPCHSKAGVF